VNIAAYFQAVMSVGKPEVSRPGVDGRIILKCIVMKWDGEAWTGFIWLRIGAGGGLL
jgi:hypothetical protein